MKIIVRFLITAFILIAVFNCSSAFASTVASGTCGTGINWTLNSEGKLTISGSGEMEDYDNYNSVPWYSYPKRSQIKQVVFIGNITAIGKNSFRDCLNMTSIMLPASLVSIGEYAFYHCTELTEIDLPGGVTNIGSMAFSGCMKLTGIELPDGITCINSSTFSGCNSLLGTIVIPNNVMSIGNYAFSGCTGLTNIMISDNVTSIGNSAFSECTSLKSIHIPASVTNIGHSAFSGCISLENIIIPMGVTSLESDSFANCTSMKTITIPDSVTSIGYSAFSECKSLESVIIPTGVTRIESNSFNNCTGLRTVTIPDSVTSFGDYAFKNCISLTGIRIPHGLRSIGSNAFYGCENLSGDIVLPDSTGSLGSYAFYGCTKLSSITLLSNDVLFLDSTVFAGCGSIFINDADSRYATVNGALFSKDMSYLFHYPCNNSANEYTIPDNVTRIGDFALKNCTNLISVTIPNSITSIPKGAFEGCTNLAVVTISKSVTSIGEAAFNGCTGLNTVYYDGKDYNGDWGKITIGGSNECLTNANRYYIYDAGKCGNNLTYMMLSDGRLIISGTGPMYNYGHSYAPWYTGASGISSIVFQGDVTSIGSYAFEYCTELKSVFIPESVTSIGEFAFDKCTAMTDVSVSNSVTSIGNHAFSNCSAIKSLVIPSSVASIGQSAFSSCWGITDIVLEDGVARIEGNAFERCSGIASLFIPDSVVSIGDNVLLGCSKLAGVEVSSGNTFYTSVDGVLYSSDRTTLLCYPVAKANDSFIIPDGVSRINRRAFSDCKKLVNVTIPDSLTDIGDNAFYGCSNLLSLMVPDSVTAVGYNAFPQSTVLVVPLCYSAAHQWAIANGNQTDVLVHQDVVTDEAVEPGCDDGLTEGSHCAVCGEILVSQAVVPAVHTPETVEGYEPTCTEDGLTEEVFCAVCGVLLQEAQPVPALGHDWDVSASHWAQDGSACAMDLSCSRCEETAVVEGAVLAEAEGNESCSEMGWTVYTAEAEHEGQRFTDSFRLQNVNKLPHTPETVTGTEPSCTVAGFTEGERCAVCNEMIREQEIIPALGHDWVLNGTRWGENGTSCQMSLVCQRCDEDMNVEASVTSESEINNSCTEWAMTNYIAALSLDGKTFSDSLQLRDVPPIPHVMVTEETIAPTDREPGRIGRSYCSLCGEVFKEEEIIPALWSYSDDGLTVIAYNGSETELTIPDGVTALGDELFKNNTEIVSVRIPDAVSIIGTMTFFQATGMQEIWLPASLNGIEARTFFNVNAVFHADAGSQTAKMLSFRKINFTDGNNWTMIYNIRTASSEPEAVKLVRIPDTEETELVIPPEISGVPVTELANRALADHQSLNKVHLPDSIIVIADDTFEGCGDDLLVCSSITAVARAWAIEHGINWQHETHMIEVLPGITATQSHDGLTEGSRCSECGEVLILQKVIPAYGPMDTADFILPIAVQKIDEEAFSGIRAEVVNLQQNVSVIGDRAFADCINLRQILVPASVTDFGERIFEGCNDDLMIYGDDGSDAQTWAVENGYVFVVIDE